MQLNQIIRKSKKRYLYYSLLPLICLLLMTGIGILINRRPLIALAGLVLYSICFVFFAFIDQILKKLQSLNQKLSTYIKEAEDFSFAQFAAKVLFIIGNIPIEFGLIIRGFFLSLSFWIIDFYVSLFETNLEVFKQKAEFNLILTLATLFFIARDIFFDKSINNPGTFTRIVSIFGFFQFFKNYSLIISALSSDRDFFAVKEFLSNPVWFLDSSSTRQIMNFAAGSDFMKGILLFVAMPIFGLIISRQLRSSKHADATNLRIALTLFSLWLLSVPAYFVFLMVKTSTS